MLAKGPCHPEQTIHALQDRIVDLEAERDSLKAQVEQLTKQRDEAVRRGMDWLLELVGKQTEQVRKRLAESEYIPPEVWQMVLK